MFGSLLSRDNETTPLSITDWAKQFRPGAQVAYNGNKYQAYKVNGTGTAGAGFYDSSSVVFACEANRLNLFSEARFQFQKMRGGRPGDLFGNESLSVLEEPWAGAITGDLLDQAELDVFAGGNSYWVRDGKFILRVGFDKMSVLTEAALDEVSGARIGERLLAYLLKNDDGSASIFDPSMVAHYKPYPDLLNRFIGTSWVSKCIDDADADTAMTTHKQSVVRQGGQLGYVVTTDPNLTEDQFDYAVRKYREQHEGPENAGKTLFISGGQDVKTVGQTFENLAVKATQGAGETRIAAAAQVPPVIVGLSEGLSSATYSNYGQARRRLVDGTMRPLWRKFAGAISSIVDVPSGARLWYDDRDIPFLREDVKDQAEILQADASAVQTLVNAGYQPDAVIDAVKASDLSRLAGKHTGWFSVQLQQPGAKPPSTDQPAKSEVTE